MLINYIFVLFRVLKASKDKQETLDKEDSEETLLVIGLLFNYQSGFLCICCFSHVFVILSSVQQGTSGRDNNREGPKGDPGDAGPVVGHPELQSPLNVFHQSYLKGAFLTVLKNDRVSLVRTEGRELLDNLEET